MSAAGQPERVSPDTEGEKPVRERLQKASIDASATMYEDSGDSATATKKDDKPTGSEATGTTGTAETTGPATRGRPQRKRSHDEATADDTQKASESKHGRKRSRDGTLDDDEVGDSSKRQSLDIARPHVEAADKTATNGERKSNELKRSGYSTPPSEEVKDVDPESFVSPKTKRSRVGDKKAAEAQEAVKDDAEVSKTDAAAKDAGVDKKATTTNGTEKVSLSCHLSSDWNTKPKLMQTSNTKESTPLSKEESSAKPSVEKAPASDTVTSPSAFAASGFGAFASSSTSGFGSVATGSKLSSFASPEPETKGTAATKPSTSTFGGALGAKSAFGGTASGSGFGGGSSSGFGGGSNSGFGGSSGFGGGSAFGGSAFGGSAGSKLSSFASPAGATFGGPKKATRAFGAPAGEDEEEGSGDEGEGEDENKIKSPKEDTEEKRDERFFQQDREYLPWHSRSYRLTTSWHNEILTPHSGNRRRE